MSLEITTPPAVEPVTVDEVKARLRLNNTGDDSLISSNIVAAREFAEKVTRRSLAIKTYSYYADRFPCPYDPIRLPAPPLISISEITYLDATLTPQTWSSAEYFVAIHQSPGLVVPLPGLIYPSAACVPGAVRVVFQAGYADCPEHIKEGIRQLAVHIYEHPEAVSSEGLKEAPLALMTFFNANKIYVF